MGENNKSGNGERRIIKPSNYEIMYKMYCAYVGDGRKKNVDNLHEIFGITRNRLVGLRCGVAISKDNAEKIKKNLYRKIAHYSVSDKLDIDIFTNKMSFDCPKDILVLPMMYDSEKNNPEENALKRKELDELITKLNERYKYKQPTLAQKQFYIWCKILKKLRGKETIDIDSAIAAINCISKRSISEMDINELKELEGLMIEKLHVLHTEIKHKNREAEEKKD